MRANTTTTGGGRADDPLRGQEALGLQRVEPRRSRPAPGRRHAALVLAAVLLAAIAAPTALAPPAAAHAGENERVSVDSTGVAGNSQSFRPAVSADGRYVAFDSAADNLVPGDTNGRTDVFVHDRATGQTTRVSVTSAGGQGNGPNSRADISADGRFVVFDTWSTNLVEGDTNLWPDVLLHDRATGQTTRVSVDSDGRQARSGGENPRISADGRFVTFWSISPSLVAGDTNGTGDVFVHDVLTGQTTRVSVDSAGRQVSADNMSQDDPEISADGRYVTFASVATTLVEGDTNGVRDIFRHDRATGETIRVSVDGAGAQADGPSRHPSISADGSSVAFESRATNLAPGDGVTDLDVFVRDTGTGDTLWASQSRLPGGGTPSISANGQLIAFDSEGTGAGIYVFDRASGTTVLESQHRLDGTAQAGGHPALSADGLAVAFHSRSPHLVPGDTEGQWDVFVHVRAASTAAEVTKVVVGGASQDGWHFTLAGPGLPPGGVATAVGGAGGTARFGAPLTSSGTYTITEAPRTGWDLSGVAGGSPILNGCSFTVSLPDDAGGVVGCTLTNTKRATPGVVKTVSGAPPDASSVFGFELRTGASPAYPGGEGLVLASDNTGPGGTVDFDTLRPAGIAPGAYQLCEVGVLPGWTPSLVDPDAFPDGWFVPNSSGNPDLDNSTICVPLSLPAGFDGTVAVDNRPPPGGQARTIGFWKNWNACSGGGQRDVLGETLGTLPSSGLLVGDLFVDTCAEAVAVLGKSSLDGTKRAGDAAYQLAAQLLAAELNRQAGAEMCSGALTAIDRGQSLLAENPVNFSARGSYLTKASALRSEAGGLAAVLDAANNNIC